MVNKTQLEKRKNKNKKKQTPLLNAEIHYWH